MPNKNTYTGIGTIINAALIPKWLLVPTFFS